MNAFLKRFRKEDDGAVTVDWVVLTAAMTGFGVALASVIVDAANDPAEGIGAVLTDMEIQP